MDTSLPTRLMGMSPAHAATNAPVSKVAAVGGAVPRVQFAEPRQQPVPGHGEEDPRLPQHEHQDDGGEPRQGPELDQEGEGPLGQRGPVAQLDDPVDAHRDGSETPRSL